MHDIVARTINNTAHQANTLETSTGYSGRISLAGDETRSIPPKRTNAISSAWGRLLEY